MPPKKQDEDKFYCDLCNIIINSNDKKNHLNGSRHKYKLRQKESKNKNEGEFECNICKTTLTNDEFYKIHIGSKTHRRNCRKRGIKASTKNITNYPVSSEIDNAQLQAGEISFKPKPRKAIKSTTSNEYIEPIYYKSTKEKYRSTVAKNREEIFHNYLNCLLAYWGVTLAINPKVEDYKFSVNNKEWGKFGDVVLEIDYRPIEGENCVRNIYAINLKYISNNSKQLDDINKGKFNFSKLVAETLSAQRPKNDEIIKYIIFTTADPSPKFQPKLRIRGELFHNKNHCEDNIDYIDISGRSLNRNDMINTVDDKDNAFLLFSTDKTHPLPKVYLYTGQKKLKRFGSSIDTALSKRFDISQIEIHKHITHFVEDWIEDLLGGTYKLNKEDILVKIGDILLSPFKAELEVENVEAQHSFTAWKQAINAVDVTILHKHPFIMHSVCKPINLNLEQNYNLIIDPNTKQVKIPQDKLENLNKALAMYLFEETVDGDLDQVPLFDVYRAFWKAGLAPLILEAEEENDREFILQTIMILKDLGLTRKYILKVAHPKAEYLTKTMKYLTYFLNLYDVIDKLPPSILDNAKIFVSENFSIDLSTLQANDKYFFKSITANEFFDLALGKYNMKQCHDMLLETEPEWKLVLNDAVIKQLKYELGSDDQTQQPEEEKAWLRGLDPALF